MRLPSLASLAQQSRAVVARFPWTMVAGTVAAAAAIAATTKSTDSEEWARVVMVAALGLPLTLALSLFAEERRLSRAASAALHLTAVALLVLFYLVWPGPDRKHDAIRYFQLSAGLHLLAAFLPFLGQPETGAFWQYNRRLFLGFLRAYVFSQVLFFGLAIALGALDQLFGVDVPGEAYGRMAIVIAFVVNTAIFLAAVPFSLRELAGDTEYPRVLKVFSQYILTPLVFIYLVMLIAYLVKIVVGGEWPSGWIGWLVTSVAVAGLLGFLLIHPLRDDPGEPWIRTYSRWLFVGLIPAALMLLVAFWKRILPYGLTELRLLGILLGLWLLGVAVSYTLRPRAGIRLIPITLAILLLVTLYGPLSVTRLSVASQGLRLKDLVAEARRGSSNDREASAALRFLLDHGARTQIAAAIPGELPVVEWDSIPERRYPRDSVAERILEVAGMRYLPEQRPSRDGYFYVSARPEGATSIEGYQWMIRVNPQVAPVMAGADSVSLRYDTLGVVQVTLGRDTAVFDLRTLARDIGMDSTTVPQDVPAERLRLPAITPGGQVLLALESMNGRWEGSNIRIHGWQGMLLFRRRDGGAAETMKGEGS
ncbi:MAG TPA: DUF4153 domain-containing protein [Gemmatimonadales bacterium]|nr:DUF4153 domain-containing protein [Gemmatimonadales bacterium]